MFLYVYLYTKHPWVQFEIILLILNKYSYSYIMLGGKHERTNSPRRDGIKIMWNYLSVIFWFVYKLNGRGKVISHQLAQCVWNTEGHSMRVCLRIIMATLWNREGGNYLHEMSSYGERSRYLYSKMCCAGEWRDLWARGGGVTGV